MGSGENQIATFRKRFHSDVTDAEPQTELKQRFGIYALV